MMTENSESYTQSSTEPSQSSTITNLPTEGMDIKKYRETKEGRTLVAWVKSEHTKARMARKQKETQWFSNMSMFYGQHWLERTKSSLPSGYADKFHTPTKPYYHERKTINRIRSYVRWEMSKMLSSFPTAQAIPSSSEDQDQRAAFAAEQAWTSISEAKKLRQHLSRTMWWTIVTGNGFLKTHWDPYCKDKLSGGMGDIKYGTVTPFHLFVPDMREQEIEDQPFVINAYTKTVEWAEYYFSKELNGIKLAASTSSANTIIEGAELNLQATNEPDSVIVYETWVKPGAHKLLPEGGVIISIDDILISCYKDGFPYGHGMYPFTKFEHIPTATFYADSPIVDLTQLQREYNGLRSEISEAGKRMAKPQLLATMGSIVPSKVTNEPGLIIQYKPGMPPPQPLPMAPLPQYYLDQQDRILNDWIDISGEREVSRGSTPPGVTSGTAISYLQEASNQYLTPQYQSIEAGVEKVATQTIELFVQYVDLPRKIRTIGADGAFDTMLLQGSDIASGTDIRIEPGSSYAKSKAAQEARVMDMFAVGIIDQPAASRMLEIGGVQKIMDTMKVAESKAQRENIKMKMLKPDQLEEAKQEAIDQIMQQLEQEAQQNPGIMESPEIQQMMQQLPDMPAPLIITVDDFDVHEVHIDTHNKFRMSQEYEILPEELKQQFIEHVGQHEAILQQKQMQQFLQAIPGDGTQDGGAPGSTGNMEVQIGGPQQGAGAMMAPNGAVPDMAPEPPQGV
jgi:hypothetical protein